MLSSYCASYSDRKCQVDTPSDGCLGSGAYFAARRKAERFAHDFGQGAPALVRCRLTLQRPCYVEGDCVDWREGHDGCRAHSTSRSSNPEWCVKDSGCIEVLEVIDLKGSARPAN